LKGGVGRTTALAVAAAHIAGRGLRVLAIDLDLEAPGIGSMLLSKKPADGVDQRPRFGAVDYLLESNIQNIPNSCLTDFVGKSQFAGGFIDVVPAVGRETEQSPYDFIPKLSRALTEAVQDGVLTPLHAKIRSMVKRFEDYSDYDVILIDARAGIAELTAAPILTLGANVFLFATDQEQTFVGYSYLLSYLSRQTDFSQLGEEEDWRSMITFVQSKAGTERQRKAFRDRLYALCAEWLYEDSEQPLAFSFAPGEEGLFMPHNATFVRYDQAYDAFEPTLNGDHLDPDVYHGPFGSFLSRFDDVLSSNLGR
jgi:cellulose biosynthesis protein BcsQ